MPDFIAYAMQKDTRDWKKDTQRAFDIVSHRMLIETLEQVGRKGKWSFLLANYLQNKHKEIKMTDTVC